MNPAYLWAGHTRVVTMSSGGKKLVTTVNRLLAGSNTRIATSRPSTQHRTDGFEVGS